MITTEQHQTDTSNSHRGNRLRRIGRASTLALTAGLLATACLPGTGGDPSSGGVGDAGAADATDQGYEADGVSDDTWNDQTWSDDTSNDDTWNDQTWNDDTWNDDTWRDQTWNDDTSNDDTWSDDTWNDDTWNDAGRDADHCSWDERRARDCRLREAVARECLSTNMGPDWEYQLDLGQDPISPMHSVLLVEPEARVYKVQAWADDIVWFDIVSLAQPRTEPPLDHTRLRAESPDLYHSLGAGTLGNGDRTPEFADLQVNTACIDLRPPLFIEGWASDYTETNGTEFWNTPDQRVGKAAFAIQVIDVETGQVVLRTDSTWKVLPLAWGPMNPACIPYTTEIHRLPECGLGTMERPPTSDTPDFDDSAWPGAVPYSTGTVNPSGDFLNHLWDADLIWTDDRALDNEVIFRARSNQ